MQKGLTPCLLKGPRMDDPVSQFRVDGKVALVTGSTKGIGLATARVLAGAGARVLISSRKPEECDSVAADLRAEGLDAQALPCHIGRFADIDVAEAGCWPSTAVWTSWSTTPS